MGRSVRIHADDIGLTKGVTDTILEAIDRGSVTSVSLIVTGSAFEYAVEELKKRPQVRVALHFNMLRGAPLSDAAALPHLVRGNGSFRSSWLWWAMLFFWGMIPGLRRTLEQEVEHEADAQFAKIKNALGQDWRTAVDSEQHTHAIPAVRDGILAAGEKYGLEHARLCREPFFLAYRGAGSLKNYLGLNFIKHVLLNMTSPFARRAYARAGISHNDFLLGILWSDMMGQEALESGLAALAEYPNADVQACFHPGGALEGERTELQNSGGAGFFFSPGRRYERSELMRPALNELVRVFETGTFAPSSVPAKFSAHFGQIVRYGISGTLAAATHLSALYAFTEYLGIWYLLSTTLGFLMGFVVSFTLQKFWTFRNQTLHAIPVQASAFLFAQLISLGTNVLGVWFLVEMVGMHYLPAQILMLVIVAAVMFFVGKFVIFRTVPAAH